MGFHGPAGKVTLEGAIVGIPPTDVEGRIPETGRKSDHRRGGAFVVAEGIGEGGSDPAMIGWSVLGDREEVCFRKANFSGDADALVANGWVGILSEEAEDRGGDCGHSFEGPKSGTASGDGGLEIGNGLCEERNDGFVLSVGKFVPGEAGEQGVGATKVSRDFV